MGTEVYADLYFLINMSMDFLCLLITGRLMHRVCHTGRLLLSSAMGGVYAVAALVLLPGGAVGLLLDLLFAAVLCWVAFWQKKENVRRVFCAALVFAAVSMTLGGIMTVLYTWLNQLNLPFEALQGDTLSVWIFALMALIAGLITARGGRLMGLSQRSKSVTVVAVLFGRRVTLRALADTGNLLVDPVSGRGVIVAERKKLSGVLPTELLKATERGDGALLDYLKTNPKHAARIRIVPTQTATGTKLLAAILPESLTVTEGKDTYPADYLVAPSSINSQSFDAMIPKG